MKKILISGIGLLVLGIGLYIYGVSSGNTHLLEWAPELGGAGAVTLAVGIIDEVL